ncbi:MAG TPA: SGNH/GDSL hydrolase family protein [Streptosporangiaceae bacterium]|nr:SGNH/GDSL hydrolase family protein [Streptosporangiaceae bacterium]
MVIRPFVRSRTFRRASVASLALAAVVLPVSACSASGSASPPGPTHQAKSSGPSPSASASDQGGPDYLALGDSVAFGYQPASVTSVSKYLNAANFAGYPNDVAKALHLHLVNASCPGETTASMIDKSAPNVGCESNPNGGLGYRSFAPLHVAYRGSQLAFAVRYLRQHPQTKLVTIDIGANDLFLCEDKNADHCAGSDFGTTLATINKNLDEILGAVRGQGGYRGTLVVMNYYALTYGTSQASVGIASLNTTLARAAAKYGGRVADAFGAFKTASAGVGGDTCKAGLRIKLPSGDCDLHPTARGHEVLATAVERAVAAVKRG